MRRLGAPLAIVVARLARLSGKKVGIALLYHRVDPVQGDPARELVPALGAELFEAQVRHLVRHYRVVPAAELQAAARARRRGRRFPVAITFDDDHPSYTRVTLPILRRQGATATFFLSGASLDGPFRFWFEQLQALVDDGAGDELLDALGLRQQVPQGPYALVHRISETVQSLPPAERAPVVERLRALAGPDPDTSGMRRAEVEALAAEPVEIGFHTLRHEPLATLDDGELAHELSEGRAELEALTGRPATSIAYPYGSCDRRVAEGARAAGFAAGFTTRAYAVRAGDDPLLLGRLLPSFDSLGHFALQLARRLVPAPSRPA